MIAFKLKEGVCYELRNGLITEPLKKLNDMGNYKFEARVHTPEHKRASIMSWTTMGRYLTNKKEDICRFDIVNQI